MFQNIGSVNSTTIIVSIIAIIILIVFKVLNKLLKSPKVKVPVKIYKMGAWTTRWIPWPVPIPSQLIVVRISFQFSIPILQQYSPYVRSRQLMVSVSIPSPHSSNYSNSLFHSSDAINDLHFNSNFLFQPWK